VIDFGVARVVAPGLEQGVNTTSGQAFGTLQYASPEQLSGDWRDVDVRTDVYALGALFYELLAGRPYCDINDMAIAQVIRSVCQDEPKPPSTFSGKFPRELDWIVLKCLRKDREARYGTVEELGADLKRCVDNQPVAAGPLRASYRARKFVARNRGAVGAGVLVLLSLIVGLVGTSLALGTAKREHARAENALAAQAVETERANVALRRQTAVVDALTRIFGAVYPDEDGRKVTVFELLERERPKLDDEFAQDPGLRAALQSFLGAAYQSLGLQTEGDEMLSAAVAGLEQQADTDPEQLAWLKLMLAKTRANQSRFAQAQALFDASLPVLDQLGKLHSSTGIRGLRLQAGLLSKQGKTIESVASYRRVVEISEEVLGADHVDTIMAMGQLSKQLNEVRERREALELARRAHERALRAFEPQHPLTVFTEMLFGKALAESKHYTEAVPVLRACLERTESMYGPIHPNSIQALEELAWTLIKTGELEEAEALAREALERVFANHASMLDFELWARICIADVLVAKADPTGSAEQLQIALERLDGAGMPGHPAHFRLRWGIAELDLAAGSGAGSEALALREQERAKGAIGGPSKTLAQARGIYGRALWAQGQLEAARVELEACRQQVLTWSDPELAALSDAALKSLVDVFAKLDDPNQSERIAAISAGMK
jgi:tetratricopeptide (TPR) repeat protein